MAVHKSETFPIFIFPQKSTFIKSLNFNNFIFIVYEVRVRNSHKMCVRVKIDAYEYGVNFGLIGVA